ncbi:titin [Dermacentor silvarum]|uniref:titin n=1 Tax=Dermacentor silvarum TaxID=543639 RepID=UPI002100BF8C|nr:titin [Dermacentor silvarum]
MEGEPPLSFAWLKNDEKIESGAKFTVEHVAGKMTTLTVREVSAADIGNYTCTVSNVAGSDRYAAALLVTVEPPRLQPFTFPVIKQASKKVTVHCAVFEGSEPLQFAWFKDGSRLSSGGARNQVKQLSGTVSSLTIPQVGAEDIGNYTCTVSNAAGSDSVTSPLLVKEPPRLHPFAFPKDHPLGQAIAVTCIASQGAQPLHFEWLKDGRPLPAQGHKAISKMVTATVSVLTVLDVGAEDVGNYTCTATNAAGSDGFTAELVVAEAPKLQPVYIAKDHPLLETLVVSCIAIRGSQPLKFAWFKDGRALNEGTRALPRSLTDTLSTLTIPKVTAEDVGNYTCRVSTAVGSDSYSAELLVTERPLIMPFSFPENAVLGQKTTVTCVVSSGAGPFRLAWTHDAKQVDSSHRRHVKIFSENVAALTIEAIAAEDVGNYTCTVSNAAGSASYTAALRVEAPPMIMPISLANNIALGEKILLTCAVTRGTAPFEIRWTHEGRPVTNTKNKYAASVTSNIATLTIEKVTAEDVGNYTCSASNDVGRDTVTATLMVEEAPRIQPFAFPKEPLANSKMVISCNAHVGTEPITFVWLRDGQELRSGTKVKQKIITETVSMLIIPEVSSEDIGNYTCEATNRFGRDTFTAPLVLTESPKIQPFSFPKNHPVGKDVTVTCFATEGALPLTFAWLKDGRKLASGSKFAVRNALDKMSTLIIHEVSGADIGNYTCQVSNEAGDDVFTASLLVTGGSNSLS